MALKISRFDSKQLNLRFGPKLAVTFQKELLLNKDR